MQVALVTETYPPEVNGVAMTLSQLVAGLKTKGRSVQVVRPIQPNEGSGLSESDELITVSGFPIPGYPGMRFGLFCKGRLERLWRRSKPDIVHVATEGPLGLSAIRAARRLGIPCTSTFHTNFHSYAEHYHARFFESLTLSYLRWIHNATLCTMTPTQALANELAESGFANMDVFGRGVRLDHFNPSVRDSELRRSWGASENDLVVTHVSRMASEKNYELLFKTYQIISDEIPSAKFIIAGDGPVRRKWEKQFPKANFLGSIGLDSRKQLGRIYASSDLFLYPSETETYGNVLTEALAVGLPTVAYDYAAAGQHVTDGINGLKVPLGAETEFIAASLRIARDSKLRRSLGAAAANYAADHLDWEPVIERFESILLRVVKREYHSRAS